MPVVSRTRATLRSAEFGFFGVVVKTRVHTPRRCGEPRRAGVFDFSVLLSRPLRTSWAIVGTENPRAVRWRGGKWSSTGPCGGRRKAHPGPARGSGPVGTEADRRGYTWTGPDGQPLQCLQAAGAPLAGL